MFPANGVVCGKNILKILFFLKNYAVWILVEMTATFPESSRTSVNIKVPVLVKDQYGVDYRLVEIHLDRYFTGMCSCQSS